MFRKRKNPTPDFRIPVPYNPVSGEYAPLGLDPTIIGKTDADGITARSGTTPGTGTVNLYRMPRGATTLTDIETEVTCFNIASGDVSGDTYILMRQDEYDRYWIIVEDCA